MLSIKFKPESIRAVSLEVEAKIRNIIKSPALLSELGDVMIKDIKFQTRRGVNSITGGKFIPLSESWIRERDKISQATSTHEAFSSKRSNITITGQLMDAMRKKLAGRGVQLYFAGTHKPYTAKYVEHYIRGKKKRRIRLRTVKGFQTSHGGIEYVNTGRSGNRKVGKPIANDKLAEYVSELRPFFHVRNSLLPQLKSVVIRFIRRKI